MDELQPERDLDAVHLLGEGDAGQEDVEHAHGHVDDGADVLLLLLEENGDVVAVDAADETVVQMRAQLIDGDLVLVARACEVVGDGLVPRAAEDERERPERGHDPLMYCRKYFRGHWMKVLSCETDVCGFARSAASVSMGTPAGKESGAGPR